MNPVHLQQYIGCRCNISHVNIVGRDLRFPPVWQIVGVSEDGKKFHVGGMGGGFILEVHSNFVEIL